MKTVSIENIYCPYCAFPDYNHAGIQYTWRGKLARDAKCRDCGQIFRISYHTPEGVEDYEHRLVYKVTCQEMEDQNG